MPAKICKAPPGVMFLGGQGVVILGGSKPPEQKQGESSKTDSKGVSPLAAEEAVQKVDADVIAAMKCALHAIVSEWVGFDVPQEGTEDYDEWIGMIAEVDATRTLDDVIDFLESRGYDSQEFLDYWGQAAHN